MADRFKLVRVALTRRHRYRRYRAATMSLTLAVLFAVPLSGLARVDLWGGAHWALCKPVALKIGIVAVGASIAGFYGMTFLINMIAGRMFCGFGCPIGQMSRFADAIDAQFNDAALRRRAWTYLIAFALVLSSTVALWWVAAGVFVSGDLVATALAVGGIAATTAYAVFHARYFRWNFCRKLCPIGLYYSVVQTGALVTIDFDAAAACTDCGACAGICPVHLDPRHLSAAIDSPGGLAFGGLPADSHCLRCGSCVEICEHMMRKQPGTPAMGFRSPRRHAAAPHPAVPAEPSE